jgi:hypothetical protein
MIKWGVGISNEFGRRILFKNSKCSLSYTKNIFEKSIISKEEEELRHIILSQNLYTCGLNIPVFDPAFEI